MEVPDNSALRLVVIGHGPAGHRLVEALRERDTAHSWQITVIGEEIRPAHDRVAPTSYLTEGAELGYPAHGPEVTLLTGDRVVVIDRANRTVTTRSGACAGYDELVLATGSAPFVPAVPGKDLPGVTARHVEACSDEWCDIFEDLVKLRRFVSFVDAPDRPDPSIAFEPERDQIKPVLVTGPQLEVMSR